MSRTHSDPGPDVRTADQGEPAPPAPADAPAPLRLATGFPPFALTLQTGLARVERLDLLGVLLVDRLRFSFIVGVNSSPPGSIASG